MGARRPRIRDHAAEYRRRLERSFAKGLSRDAARGHAKENEMGASEMTYLQKLARDNSEIDEDGMNPARHELRDRLKQKATSIEEFIAMAEALGLTKESSIKLWFGY